MRFQVGNRIILVVCLLSLVIFPARARASEMAYFFVKLRSSSVTASQTLAQCSEIERWQPSSVPGWFRVFVLEHRLARARTWLENNENVLAVEEDQVVRAALVPDDTYWSLQWGAAKINAPAAWNVTTGASVAERATSAPAVCAHE